MKLQAWLVMLLMAVTFTAFAQPPYPSNLGRFQVDQVKGCAPLSINVSLRPGFQCDPANPCDMDYGDGAGFQNLTFSHTYTQPGVYTLRVLIQSLSPIDQITITVLPNTPPQFDVYACENNEVSVIIPDMTYDRYHINFNDGSPVVDVLKGNAARASHVYASSGNKTVSVTGELNGAAPNCNPAVKQITAIATLPVPVINQLRVTDATSVQLNFTGQNGIQYRLEIAPNGSPTFQLLKTLFNVTSETVTNLRTDDNYYCFRIGAFDPCNNKTVYSNVICSANFDVAAQNNVINATWVTTTSGVTNFRLAKIWSSGGQTVTVSSTPYADTEITCGTVYCYTLTTNYPNGSRSISLEKCATAISTDTPPSVDNISTVVNNPGVTLEWLSPAGPPPSTFSVFKITGGVSNTFGTVAQNTIDDPAYLTEFDACYAISYIDVCGNQSNVSEPACPIQLTGNLKSNNTIDLTWSAYNGWVGGVKEYIVEKYSSSGQLLQTFNPGTSLTFSDDTEDLTEQTVVYIIRAVANTNGVSASISNTLTIIKNPNLFHPTAFTPNGDKLNDKFSVYGQFITQFEMEIFNRWGEMLFATSSLEDGWDGTYKGNAMPEGTYTFVARITDRVGRTFKKSGTVLLLRKK